MPLYRFQRFFTGCSFEDLVSATSQVFGKHLPAVRLIFDDQDARPLFPLWLRRLARIRTAQGLQNVSDIGFLIKDHFIDAGRLCTFHQTIGFGEHNKPLRWIGGVHSLGDSEVGGSERYQKDSVRTHFAEQAKQFIPVPRPENDVSCSLNKRAEPLEKDLVRMINKDG